MIMSVLAMTMIMILKVPVLLAVVLKEVSIHTREYVRAREGACNKEHKKIS